MIRLLAQLVVGILANALGLLAAAVILDSFTINATSFIIAVAIFSLSTVVLGPLIMKIALQNAPFLMGGIALVTTLIGLIVTVVVSDGIAITGLSTWVVATLIIWIFSLLANVLLPLIIFKKALQARKQAKV